MNDKMVGFRFCGLLFLLHGLGSACLDAGEPSTPCQANEAVECVCTDGRTGYQSCASDGSRFMPCTCSSDMDVSGPDTYSDNDSSSEDALSPKDVTLEDAGPPVDAGEPTDTLSESDASLPACDPPLVLEPEQLWTNTYSLVTVHAAGGSGNYTFIALDNQSNGTLNALTGSYLAGGVVGVVDTLGVIDSQCSGQAKVMVNVVDELSVSPLDVTIEPSGSFTFSAEGGSGTIDFSLVANSSGGSVTSQGVYTAGKEDGDDVILITDVATGQSLSAIVRVESDANLVPVPEELVLPLGSSFPLGVEGGSGSLLAEVASDVITVANGMIEGIAVGSTEVALTDAFTGMTTTMRVTVTESLTFEAHRSADLFNEDEAIAPGDLNGDGYPDAILGVGEASVEAVNGGAVYIYAGTEQGLDPSPVRIIGGGQRDQRFGARLVAGDVDGDGLVDLLVAGWHSSIGGIYAGGVFLYRGVKDGFFEEEPSQVWSGDNGYDYFGYSLALCDFNGDGGLDLAVGAYAGEDRDADPVVASQGAIHVFLNAGAGIGIAPATKLFGYGLEADGTWVPRAVQLGYALTAGDFDGDGLCDLAATAAESQAGGNKDGAVYVYKGVAPEGFSKGGLTKLPVQAMFTEAAGDWLGRELTSGDYNGDQLADLVVAHSYSNQMTGAAAGAIYALYGGPLPDVFDEPLAPLDADWIAIGLNGGNYLGQSLNTGDVNGDGLDDLLVGARQGEVADGPNNTGSVKVFFGAGGEGLQAVPDMQVGGEGGGNWFGAAVATLGDVDDDGQAELFVHASRHSAYGYLSGLAYLVSVSNEGTAMTPLELPAEASGQRFGYDVAVFEREGAEPAFLVGASHHDTPNTFNEGAIFAFEKDGDTFSLASILGPDAPRIGNNDRLGWALSPAGDFDGDGVDDLAVVIHAEYRPGTLDNAQICGESCPNSGTKNCGQAIDYPGAVFVFGGKANGGFESMPLFQYFSPESKQTIRNVAGAGDVNGDGYDDLLVSSRTWDLPGVTNVGGVRLILGRPQQPYALGKVQVICEDDFTFHGHTKDDQMGRGLASLGDLDGDGCSDFAVGSDLEDPSAQGVVRVFYGWDKTGNHCAGNNKATFTALRSNSSSARAGFALAGGADVDGDDVPDMVVGAPYYRVNSASVGAFWLVRGSYILSLPREDAVSAMPSTIGPHPFAAPAEMGLMKVTGKATGDEFGWSVALLPNAEADGRAMIVVGSPGSSLSGVPASGAALVYRYTMNDFESGLESIPWLALSGETYRTGGKFGAAVAGGSGPSGNYLMVGAFYGTSENMDSGTAYIVPVPPVD